MHANKLRASEPDFTVSLFYRLFERLVPKKKSASEPAKLFPQIQKRSGQKTKTLVIIDQIVHIHGSDAGREVPAGGCAVGFLVGAVGCG